MIKVESGNPEDGIEVEWTICSHCINKYNAVIEDENTRRLVRGYTI